jgi:putative peptidoglycan lipid II flippase
VGGASVLRAYHQGEGRFKLAAINTIMVNIIVIGFVLTSKPDSITWLLAGTLIGLSVDFFVQAFYARKHGLKIRKTQVSSETLKQFALLILPIVIGTLVGQVNTVIDKAMGSTLPAGSITYLNGAFKLTTFANGIFAVTLGTVMFPIMATCLAGGNVPAFKKSFFKSMNMVLLFTVPITLMMMVFSHPIIQLLFERGAFTANATNQTSLALIAYSFGLIALGGREVIVKAFFALQDTKTPMRNGILTVALNIGLNLVLIGPLAHVGLALSSSISATITTVLLMWQLRKKVGSLGGRQIGMDFIKVLGAAAVMTGVALGLNGWIQHWEVSQTVQSLLELFVAGGTSVIVYAILIELLHVEAWDSTKEKILERLGRA